MPCQSLQATLTQPAACASVTGRRRVGAEQKPDSLGAQASRLSGASLSLFFSCLVLILLQVEHGTVSAWCPFPLCNKCNKLACCGCAFLLVLPGGPPTSNTMQLIVTLPLPCQALSAPRTRNGLPI